MKKVLTIAGSDSSGGAGIQADIKTFCALGVYGMSAITAITAQNTQGVMGVEEVSSNMIAMQLEAVFQDIEVDAVKIGMVSTVEIIEIIAACLDKYSVQHVVLDTVMISKSGCHLLHPEAVQALKSELIPRASIVTPNLHEAEVLTGIGISTLVEMEKAACMICDMGAGSVVIKGGHRIEDATDILYDRKEHIYYPSERIQTSNTHGTGCTFSSAIAGYLALGYDLKEAVGEAKQYIHGAIQHSLNIGKGVGPTNHLYRFNS